MANQVSTTFTINAATALNQLAQYQQQLRNTIQLQTQLGTLGTNPGGGGGGAGTSGGGRLFGGLGSFIAGAVSTAAVISAIRTTTAAVKESEAANRALAASALEAGKSYGDLADSSLRFGQAALISESAAARSTAQLQRLLTLAGSPDQLEQYQKGFLDLAAARGVAFDELDTLFQGIIAGTDDALNRFGKQDPSKLAEQYARSLGKTVEQLTEQEKVLSRLKAFDKDFGLFSGANEARINSFSGSVDRLNKSIDDIVTNFGSWAVQTRIVRDNIGALQLVLGGGATGEANAVRKMISQGMTNEEILRATGGGQGPGIYDKTIAYWNKTGLGVLSSLIFNGQWKDFSATDVANQQDAFRLQQIQAERDLMATEAKTRNPQASTGSVADQLKAQFEQADKVVQQLRTNLQTVRETIVGILAERNPFVTIFENAYQSLERVRELTRGFGKDLQNLAIATVQRQALQQLEGARISSQLQSFNLLSSAQDFRSGINLEGLTAQQQARRQLGQLRGQLNAIGAYDSAPTMPVLAPGASPQEIRRARAQYEEARRRWEAGQPLRDRQIIELTQNMNPARLDAPTRELAANARVRESERLLGQEQEARALFKSLSKVIAQDGIRVVVASGEQLVRIVNEAPGSATVSRGGNAVSSRYGS